MKITFLKRSMRAPLLVFFVMFQIHQLRAQDVPSDSVVKERIQCIQKMLDEGQQNANLWRNGWIIGYSALTVGQGAAYYISTDENIKMIWAMGSATTLACAAIGIFTPMLAAYTPPNLSRIPENSKEEQQKKLEIAEKYLKFSAEQEKEGRSWKVHALYGIVNAGEGVLVCVAFDQSFWSGFTNFALSSIVSEAQIWSQPTKAISDFQSYCRRYKPEETPEALRQKPVWHVNAYPGGVVVNLVF
jgi:hypothetical protein